MDDAKLSQYAAGSLRKSRREKEQEIAEAKKREEETNAAQAYAEFLDEFESGSGAGSRRGGGAAFVKASSGGPSSGPSSAYSPSKGLGFVPSQPSSTRESRVSNQHRDVGNIWLTMGL